MSTAKWSVVVSERDRMNLNAACLETVLDQPSEIAARQVYRDSVKAAKAKRYESVKLRQGDEIVKCWPGT